jgi:enterochelin esterase family protein
MVLVDHGGQARFMEYASSDTTIRFLEKTVLPFARERLNVIDDPTLHGVLGASMGGLMALYTALRAPAHFGRLISQSGAFAIHGPQDFEPIIFDVVRYGTARPVIWMDVGRYEGLLKGNREMYDLLRERGYDVTYREYNAGHNHESWRNDVWRGLETLYGE